MDERRKLNVIMNTSLREDLGEILESHSITLILNTLSVLCEEKAEYAKRHEAIGVGTRWQRRSGQLSRLATQMEEEKTRHG